MGAWTPSKKVFGDTLPMILGCVAAGFLIVVAVALVLQAIRAYRPFPNVGRQGARFGGLSVWSASQRRSSRIVPRDCRLSSARIAAR